MKKLVAAMAVGTIGFCMGVGNASAGDTRTGRAPPPRPDVPAPRCVLIGSDVWECTDCFESLEDNMSICFTFVSKSEVPKEP